jgi:hypothetical protein
VSWSDGAGEPFAGVDSAYAITLRMHQPLIAAGGKNLRTARLISNLQYTEERRDIGANRNAPPTTGRARSAGGSWGRIVPALVTGIADRENGGGDDERVTAQTRPGHPRVHGVNHRDAHRDRVPRAPRRKQGGDRVHIEGGSWTNNISLGTRLRCVIPRERASSRCHQRVLARESRAPIRPNATRSFTSSPARPAATAIGARACGRTTEPSSPAARGRSSCPMCERPGEADVGH